MKLQRRNRILKKVETVFFKDQQCNQFVFLKKKPQGLVDHFFLKKKSDLQVLEVFSVVDRLKKQSQVEVHFYMRIY